MKCFILKVTNHNIIYSNFKTISMNHHFFCVKECEISILWGELLLFILKLIFFTLVSLNIHDSSNALNNEISYNDDFSACLSPQYLDKLERVQSECSRTNLSNGLITVDQ